MRTSRPSTSAVRPAASSRMIRQSASIRSTDTGLRPSTRWALSPRPMPRTMRPAEI